MGQVWPRSELRPCYQDSNEKLKGLVPTGTLYSDWKLVHNGTAQRSDRAIKYVSCGLQSAYTAVDRAYPTRALWSWMKRDYANRLKLGQSVTGCRPVLIPLGETMQYDGGIETREAEFGGGYVCGTCAYTLKQMDSKFGEVDMKKQKTEHATLPLDSSPMKWQVTSTLWDGGAHLAYDGWCTMTQQQKTTDTTHSIETRIHPTPEGPLDTGFYISLSHYPKHRVWSLSRPID
jgi:hypothetical protein